MSALTMMFLGFFILNSPASAGEIHGTIKVEPPYPEITAVKVEKKVKDSCADVQKPEGLIVSRDGGVQNTVIWLEGNFEKKYPSGLVPELDQKACRFEPHVSIVPAGQVFEVKNSDPVTHDVRGFLGAKMLFRFEMGPNDKPVQQTFQQPGIYLLRCGFHTWMHAIAVSAPHAYYAVSNQEGKFIFADVPEGDYQLHLWHETLGEARADVKVSSVKENFSYTFKKV